MNSRHSARELAVQFLFQRDLNNNELDEALSFFWEANETSKKNKKFAEQIIHGVLNDMDAIDRHIQDQSKNWDVKRMAVLDRAVIRMAIYEMLHCQDIPPVVSINEAVDIAKDFSGDE